MSATAEVLNESTAKATEEDILSPRFYTTDMSAFENLDMSPVQREWDALMAEFRADNNRLHFQRDDSFTRAVEQMPPELYDEFLDFLISSCTSEFSGCVLYSEIKKAVANPDVRELMGHMARDESRHAGFLNKSLKDFDRQLDLARLTRVKKYTYFKPKFIYYATYLSEKIGYARYITIFRELERHPERRFHPIFKWFHDWCNDEFRHGEAFALIIRSDPSLTRGVNKLWIRFFLLAVFSTMYLRDHRRPAIHAAFGLPPDSFGFTVFRITSEISRQVFPITLDIENPAFRRGLDRLLAISRRNDAARARGGLLGALTRAGCSVASLAVFARLYLISPVPNALPENTRLDPAW
jgi:magnesium-protoporphyrin IX monomethyl ester (oxidative) cyclase